MENCKFQGLPPLKRFRFLQQKEDEENQATFLPLPAKKRKESREISIIRGTTCTSTYCLPTKKRVWALQPNGSPTKPPPAPLDLNIEYNPQIEEKEEESENPEVEIEIPIQNEDVQLQGVEEFKEAKNLNNTDDDDGIVCAICDSTDGDPSDPIVLCDGCDLMAHTTCYGIKDLPEDDWFCSQCLFRNENGKNMKTPSCCLCPMSDGALKPTTDGRWAHVVCALYVPEVFFKDPESREGIDCSMIPQKRWDGICYLCKSASGCVLNCSEPKCPLAFHVTCGMEEDLHIEYKTGRNKSAIVAGFCKPHTELWEKQQQTGKFRIVARDESK
ncbi:hypothetical protein RJ641_034262 [Dillenia turbinata]|uniref:Protein Jade-1 n=1 Tax=Dillenia turbinata TaxID=194707 RepID=A0AAN8VVC6_9MAGN